MNFKFTKKNILLSLFIFIGFASLTGSIIAIYNGEMIKGYRASNGGSINITDLSYDQGAHGQGYKVTNNSGKDQFIPTKTQAEWNSLKAHTPSGIVIKDIENKISFFGVINNPVGMYHNGCYSCGEESDLYAKCSKSQEMTYLKLWGTDERICSKQKNYKNFDGTQPGDGSTMWRCSGNSNSNTLVAPIGSILIYRNYGNPGAAEACMRVKLGWIHQSIVVTGEKNGNTRTLFLSTSPGGDSDVPKISFNSNNKSVSIANNNKYYYNNRLKIWITHDSGAKQFCFNAKNEHRASLPSPFQNHHHFSRCFNYKWD